MQPSTPAPLPALRWNQGSRGRIARLPKAVRDKLNQMMEDGVMYADIIKALGPDGVDLNESALKRWRKSGHPQWLKERQRLQHMEHMCEVAVELVRTNKGKAVEEASCQFAASQIYGILMDYNPAELKTRLQAEPEFYPRLLNVLARLSNRGLDFEQHRDHLAEQKAKIQNALTIANQRGMTPEAMDEFKRTLNVM